MDPINDLDMYTDMYIRRETIDGVIVDLRSEQVTEYIKQILTERGAW